jgi:5-oxoprolinase (ATP-hydrolysing)/N-methylhydantoinase A
MSAFDPVSLEIMWSRLINIIEECWVTLWRTSFSTIIGEVNDFGCQLMDARGNSIVHSPRSMPVFNLVQPGMAKMLLEAYPPHAQAEGDVFICNDPWVGPGHLFDVAVVTPVFRRGTLVALVGSMAHCSDIGGTKDSGNAREIYDEGLQIPPLRLYRAGVLNEDLAQLIRRNVRKPEMVFGDIQAQVSSNHVGARRLPEFMDEYGLESLEPLAKEVQSRSERVMRQAIAAIPNGVYRSEVHVPVAGERLRLPCAVFVEDDELTVDFAGAPPQAPKGAVNCTLTYTTAHTLYAVKTILTPQTASNADCFGPLHVRAPEGSILNCRYPAAVNQRTMVGWFCGPAVFRALAPVLPERVQAFTGLPASFSAYGVDAGGRVFNNHYMFGGGQGASHQVDGRSALMYPTSACNASVEVFEQRTPILIERKDLIADSAGPGQHRGGPGQRLEIRKLHADDRPVLLNMLTHATGWGMQGLLGGRAGRDGGCYRNGVEMSGKPGMSVFLELRDAADLVTVEASGGSGFGDPAGRPAELVARDLEEGYVSARETAAAVTGGRGNPELGGKRKGGTVHADRRPTAKQAPE